MAFDPRWLELPDRSPLDALGPGLQPSAGGIEDATDLGDGWWAKTQVPDDVVRALWWAASRDAVACVLAGGPTPGAGASPPLELGVGDGRYGLTSTRPGALVRVLARFDSGQVYAEAVDVDGRSLYYPPEPSAAALPFAVGVRLR